jgi:excisionase family DNA binding protein
MGLADDIDALVGDWLTLEQAAEQLEADVAKVRQLLREHKLIGVRRRGEVRIPAAFIQRGSVLKGLPGALTVLADAGFSDDEALRWLFTPDDSLPGSPVQALVENRGTEVKRRAQALAF